MILFDGKPKIEKKQLKETKFSTEQITCLEQCFLEYLSFLKPSWNDCYKWISVGIKLYQADCSLETFTVFS